MIDIERTQARLEEIKAELDWEIRLLWSGMPRRPNAIFELRLEAADLEQAERLWIYSADFGRLLA